MLAHTAPYKLKEKERLQGILSDLQSQNKLLKDAVRARQSKLEHTQQKIEEKARQWREVSHDVKCKTVTSAPARRPLNREGSLSQGDPMRSK